MTELEARYRRHFADHLPLADAARSHLPDGISSDSRLLTPFPLFMERAKGAHKWDHQGRKFLDLWAGHGALLFGHAPQSITEAVATQLAKGTHLGACHSHTTQWAKCVKAMIPNAERVRFTGSGTEANLLALHLARAYTGRSKILRFEGHYHGWYAEVNHPAEAEALDPRLALAHDQTILSPNRLEAVAERLDKNPDIGAVILEPTGPCSGVIPLDRAFVEGLRALCDDHGALLIFDEVVTGFRMSPGGSQELLGVKPDLISLAKILAGGLPGGAVTGRADILDLLSHSGAKTAKFGRKISHLGTFSGNPLSAQAGISTLQQIQKVMPHGALARQSQSLKSSLNGLFEAQGLDWAVYGQGSCLKFLIGYGPSDYQPTTFDASTAPHGMLLKRGDNHLRHQLRLALLIEGVDFSLSSFLTTAHGDEDVREITQAFDRAIHELKGMHLLS